LEELYEGFEISVAFDPDVEISTQLVVLPVVEHVFPASRCRINPV